MRLRVKKILGWLFAILLTTSAGGLLFAYRYVTDNATLASLLRQEVPRFLPGVRIDVVRVGMRLLTGDCELRHLTVWQSVDGRTIPLLRMPFLRVNQDVNALMEGKFCPTEVAVGQPTLRVKRRADGTWSFQNLVADPWPAPPLEQFAAVSGGRGQRQPGARARGRSGRRIGFHEQVAMIAG